MAILDSARPVTFILTANRGAAKPFYAGALGLAIIAEDDFAVTFALTGGATMRLTDLPGHTAQGNDASVQVGKDGFVFATSGNGGNTGIHDDLYARCISIDTGERALIICGVDSIGLFLDDVQSKFRLLRRPGGLRERNEHPATSARDRCCGIRGKLQGSATCRTESGQSGHMHLTKRG